MLLALTLGGGALSVALSSAAQAAEPSDVSIKLPTVSYSHMLVDQARQRVLITTGQYTSPRTNALLVYDFDGNLLQTVTDSRILDRPSGLALSADGTELFVASTDYITVLNADTYASAGGWLSDAHLGLCGREVALAGGKVWWTENTANVTVDCTNTTTSTWLDYKTPGVNKVTSQTWGLNFRFATPQPGAPGKLLYTSTYSSGLASYATLYDTVNMKGVSGRSWSGDSANPAPTAQDAALNADGSLVGLADGTAGFRLLNGANMADASPGWSAPPADASATAVSFSPDGSLVARGLAAPGDEADLLVQDADPAHGDAPRSFVFQDGSDGGDRIASRGLAWSSDASKLFAVTGDAAGDAYWLHIISNPDARYHSAFQGPLSVQPGSPYAGQAVSVSGTIVLNGPTAGRQPAKLTAVRTDASGAHPLDPVTAAADGSFTFQDTPPDAGSATYTVSYAGDADHDPATDVTTKVTVAPAPTTLTLAAPADNGTGGVHIAGTLTTSGTALPAGTVVRVQRRTKSGGAASLPTLRVGADGTFAFDDTPGPGDTLYTVDFKGDPNHAISSDWFTVPSAN